jgi:pimeloyl-ACP methyl ester carboxylesterase
VTNLNQQYLWIFLVFTFLALLGAFFYQWQRRKFWERAEADFSQAQWIEIDGSRVCYRQSGTGMRLVLIHGIGASSFIWRNVFAELSEKHQVISIDLPGFGLSDKDPDLDYDLESQTQRLHRILQKLSIDQAVLVGSSMGGSVCLNLMRLYPQQYLKTVAIAPATDRKLVTLATKMAAPTFSLFGFMLNRASMRLILQRISSKKDLITEHVISEYLKPFENKKNAVKVFSKALKSISDNRLPTLFSEIKNPVLILWGRGDLLVPEKTIKQLHQAVPHAIVAIHESAGHHPFEDEPEWVLAEIRKFI